MEHHSNIVPWQLLAAERGAQLAYVPLTDDHRLDMAAFADLMQREPKLVAVTHVSNALGTINDVAAIARQAQAAGATVLIDAAQSVPHLAIDVQALGVDFLAFSGHKMLGPMAAGVLYGKRALLEAMPPFLVGGSMIRKVGLTESTWAEVPAKFEAGTPAVGDAIGLGVAIEYLTNLGMDRVLAHEQAIVGYALERLTEIPGITIYGPSDPAHRSGVVSFTLARHPPPRRRQHPRRGERRRPGRPPLRPALDGQPRRGRHHPRQLLRLQPPDGRRPPHRRTAQSAAGVRSVAGGVGHLRQRR